MRYKLFALLLILSNSVLLLAIDRAEFQQRRQRAAALFHDGILVVHATSRLNLGDGFRQDPAFYYFTGLENVASALLVIDGPSGQSSLFLSMPAKSAALAESMDAKSTAILPVEISPGPEAAKNLWFDQVEDWASLEGYLKQHASSAQTLYYVPQRFSLEELPPSFGSQTEPAAPLWAVTLAKKWPALNLKDAGGAIYQLMAVQSAGEMESVRLAAKSSVVAVLAGMRAIRPGVSQRSVEVGVENACWQSARGVSFWPWAMAGDKGVFPRAWASLLRYDHLDQVLQSGDLVRLDVGCEWNHYQGDLGRTVPVSGHFTEAQRETWNIFVSAYDAGVRSMREGLTVQQLYDAWRDELVRHRQGAKTDMARRAIDTWSKRENVPFWGPHTMNLDAGFIEGPLRAGMTIDFEPIAAIDGQGYYLEDMILITRDGAEILTPGVPYTAEQIEAFMK